MLVAISQRNDENKYGDKFDNLENSYIQYLQSFGIEAIPVPNLIKDVSKYLQKMPIGGIILSGGNDIDPVSFGLEKEEGLSLALERDRVEKGMLEHALENSLPVLGICRGMQFLNVYFGGKLSRVEHPPRVIHEISIQVYQETFGEKVEVNSYHGWGIKEDDISSKLKVLAVSEDGVVEGIYHPSLPIAGIQWHPERDSPDDAFNAKIINAFLNRNLFWEEVNK